MKEVFCVNIGESIINDLKRRVRSPSKKLLIDRAKPSFVYMLTKMNNILHEGFDIDNPQDYERIVALLSIEILSRRNLARCIIENYWAQNNFDFNKINYILKESKYELINSYGVIPNWYMFIDQLKLEYFAEALFQKSLRSYTDDEIKTILQQNAEISFISRNNYKDFPNGFQEEEQLFNSVIYLLSQILNFSKDILKETLDDCRSNFTYAFFILILPEEIFSEITGLNMNIEERKYFAEQIIKSDEDCDERLYKILFNLKEKCQSNDIVLATLGIKPEVINSAFIYLNHIMGLTLSDPEYKNFSAVCFPSISVTFYCDYPDEKVVNHERLHQNHIPFLSVGVEEALTSLYTWLSVEKRSPNENDSIAYSSLVFMMIELLKYRRLDEDFRKRFYNNDIFAMKRISGKLIELIGFQGILILATIHPRSGRYKLSLEDRVTYKPIDINELVRMNRRIYNNLKI